MSAARKLALALVVLALTACGGAEDQPRTVQVRSVQGLSVVVDSQAAFTRAADFDSRIQTTVAAALQYWGGTWDLLDHVDVRLVDTAGVACGGRESLGCFESPEIRLTTRDPGSGTVACVEQTMLVHEIGHLVLGDPDHTDPRWMEMDSLATELSGRPGYSDDGPAPCETYLSVWRHPLGTP